MSSAAVHTVAYLRRFTAVHVMLNRLNTNQEDEGRSNSRPSQKLLIIQRRKTLITAECKKSSGVEIPEPEHVFIRPLLIGMSTR